MSTMEAAAGKPRPEKRNHDVWKGVSWGILALYGLFLLYPLIRLLFQAAYVDGKWTLEYFNMFWAKTYYTKTIWNSIKVSVCATALTLVIGVPLAYFYQMYEIRGKRTLEVLIVLCSMSAPFIGAYSWILLLGRSGLITTWMKSTFGISLGSIYGFNGILLVETLQLYPLVFLYVCGALKNVDNSLLEASENMGCSGIKRFFKVVIPLCMRAPITRTPRSTRRKSCSSSRKPSKTEDLPEHLRKIFFMESASGSAAWRPGSYGFSAGSTDTADRYPPAKRIR